VKLSSIKKTKSAERPRRIVLYGTHGIGKSTFGACAPAPIFIPTEDGLSDIDADAFPLAKSLTDVIQAISELASEAHEFTTVVVDTADWLERLVWEHICAQGGKSCIADFGYGKGYEEAAVKFRSVLDGLDFLRLERGMMVILLAHCKVERFENPETEAYDRYMPKLHKSTAGMLQEWADEVLFANYKVYTRTDGKGFDERKLASGGERVLYTTEKPSHLAKNRLGLPPEIPFSFAAYWELARPAHLAAEAASPI